MAILETAEHWSRVGKWLNLEKYIWDREPGALTGSKLLRNFRSFPAPGAAGCTGSFHIRRPLFKLALLVNMR